LKASSFAQRRHAGTRIASQTVGYFELDRSGLPQKTMCLECPRKGFARCFAAQLGSRTLLEQRACRLELSGAHGQLRQPLYRTPVRIAASLETTHRLVVCAGSRLVASRKPDLSTQQNQRGVAWKSPSCLTKGEFGARELSFTKPETRQHL
jgi:hypothetical protein